jgi:hypothetical protein
MPHEPARPSPGPTRGPLPAALAALGWGLVLLSAPARAGDPCPIGLELGAAPPSWRDPAADLAALKHPKAWLGMSYRAAGGGIELTVVHAGSPAAAGGLQVGDRLQAVGGRAVATEAEVGAAIDALGPDAPVPLGLERGGAPVAVELRRGPVDPLLWGLFAAAKAQDCRDPRLFTPDAGLRAAVEAGAYDAQRGFRCADAHRALKDAAPPGTVLVLRGGSRVLLVAPGSGALCVSVAEADGASPDQHAAWLERVTAPHVADRHANP